MIISLFLVLFATLAFGQYIPANDTATRCHFCVVDTALSGTGYQSIPGMEWFYYRGKLVLQSDQPTKLNILFTNTSTLINPLLSPQLTTSSLFKTISTAKTGRFQLWVSGINTQEAYTGLRITPDVKNSKISGYIDLDTLLLEGLSNNVFQGSDRGLTLFKWDDQIGNIIGMDLTRSVFAGQDSRKQQLFNYTFVIPEAGEYFWAAFPNTSAIPIPLAPREFMLTGDGEYRTFGYWEGQNTMSKASFGIVSQSKNYKAQLAQIKNPQALEAGNGTKLAFIPTAAFEFSFNQPPNNDIAMNLIYKYETTDLQYVPTSRMTWAWYNGTNWQPIATQVYNGQATVKSWNVKLPQAGNMNVSPQTIQLAVMAKPLGSIVTGNSGNAWGDAPASSASKLALGLLLVVALMF